MAEMSKQSRWEKELKKFHEVLANPKGQAIVIVGAAGSGKSTLMTMMVAYAKKDEKYICDGNIYGVRPNDRTNNVLRDIGGWQSGIVAYLNSDNILKKLSDSVKEFGDLHRRVIGIDANHTQPVTLEKYWLEIIPRLPEKVKFIFTQRPDDVLARNKEFMSLPNVVRIDVGMTTKSEERSEVESDKGSYDGIEDQKEREQKIEGENELIDVTIGAGSISDQPSKKDTLNFKLYTTAISNFLNNKETKPPLTISVEGEWGCGKSSFMLQLKDRLKDLNKQNESNIHIVEFSPWRNDKEEAVWATFVLTFLDQLSKDLGWFKATIANFKLIWKRFNWQAGWPEFLKVVTKLFVYPLTLIFIFIAFWAIKIQFLQNMEFFVKMSLSIAGLGAGVGALVVKAMNKTKELVGNPFENDLKKYVEAPDYIGCIPFVERFHKDFKSIVSTYAGNSRVYVFIDDLDRCEVPKAAELMKAINLMITNEPNLIFIIGMDRQKVAAGLAVKDEKLIRYLRPEIIGNNKNQIDGSLWRTGLNYGYDFIEKFIQLPFRIPRPQRSDIDNMMDNFATKKSEEEEKKTVPMPESKVFKKDKDLHSDEILNPDLGKKREAEIQDELEEKKKRSLELKLAHDSDHVRHIVHMVAPFLDFNPRRIKQFINLFRLQAYIAYETERIILPEDVGITNGVTLEQLGKIVAIFLRWPLLLEALAQDENLLEELSKFAEGEIDILTKEVAKYYSQDNKLMELIRFGCVREKAESKEWTKHTLCRAKIDKLLQVSPKIRSMKIVPLEISEGDSIRVSDEERTEMQASNEDIGQSEGEIERVKSRERTFFVEKYFEKGDEMKIENISISGGREVFTDSIEKVEYNENLGISEKELEELKAAIKALTGEKKEELNTHYDEFKNAKTEEEKKSIAGKIKDFLIENGIAVARSLAVEVLKMILTASM